MNNFELTMPGLYVPARDRKEGGATSDESPETPENRARPREGPTAKSHWNQSSKQGSLKFILDQFAKFSLNWIYRK